MFFTIITLSGLGTLGAAATFLALRMRSAAGRPAQQTGQRFGQIEDKIRSLKSAQKLADPVAALEIVATDLGGAEMPEKLRRFRETREKIARTRPSAPISGGGFEGSLMIPKVFRDPDPDVGMARLFFEMGSRPAGASREVQMAMGIAIAAWALLVLSAVVLILT